MHTSIVKNLPKATVEIQITIPWTDIKETYDNIFNNVLKGTEIPGFRKGKVPKKLVEDKIDKTKIYEEVVKQIIPKVYAQILEENKLVPVSTPKFELIKAKENEEWIIKATIALKPKINLKGYKEKIKEIKQGKTKIWVPGESTDKKEEKKLTLDDIVRALAEEVEIEFSDILISDETNRLLSNLIDQTQKLGLTIEQYLTAKGKTIESIRAEYANQSVRNLTIEFALSEIADKENIVVTQKDIDDLINKVEKDEDRDKLKKDSYYLAHLIRQQKTLDFLASL
ncbi:hypothetical protein COV53_00935 [Candidatus Gottesmanbacteria bacterium CG11_big_fil_rev_8_21_14_0_20_37_11]|uniref:Trigger factor n=3 Tax=Candidatus Gottesmaniibacteriota TaxID=1752720 RepID=A0A2M7RQI7_9BACT|nr:MAG: hypothetical protein AUJ73_03790 [Candidatus Gottesmanbacteria bacterium CG1_02_37_22]PIP32279.1 MAG: hypothetical protein COX23_05765 [Candidatus Gottesmanbacteria bacterium CG23_combo_of_CG06-09_8_20_14_all_37_19]PIR08847.1 MAG: hypothetical protein COV53_00935 [Candidatus Gottesmanbacteria bacterium CG11_big_fil_rev_8_21_14_0_20_37_11]PIZ02345.1 MAG: hypothetical protein COY59_05460 [Candidatus Gottesmanbacteria bacterium CG_4_10_14_0_8_um_filter_37_24]